MLGMKWQFERLGQALISSEYPYESRTRVEHIQFSVLNQIKIDGFPATYVEDSIGF